MEHVFEAQAKIDYQVEEGYQTISLKNCKKTNLLIVVKKHRSGQVFLSYDGESTQLDMQIELEEGSHLELLGWNRLTGNLSCKQTITAYKDAHAHIGYGDLQAGDSSYEVTVDQSQSGSAITLTSACIAKQKHMQVEMQQTAPYTKGEMHHFAIVEEHGDYKMKASGIIAKGAYEAQSHQATRVLTMSDKQKSEVVPVLLIDENDVKASHATTLGQPDEHQLYYLQSRGLTRNQALGLLTLGYILPISEVIDHKELQASLQEEIEEKVMKHV